MCMCLTLRSDLHGGACMHVCLTLRSDLHGGACVHVSYLKK